MNKWETKIAFMGDGLALDHFSPIESVSTCTFKDLTCSTTFMFFYAVVQDKMLLRVSIKTNEQAKSLVYYHPPCRLPRLIWTRKDHLKSGYLANTNHLDNWNIDQELAVVPMSLLRVPSLCRLSHCRYPEARRGSKTKIVCHDTNNIINKYENNNSLLRY